MLSVESLVICWNYYVSELNSYVSHLKSYVSDLNSCRFRRWPSATFFLMSLLVGVLCCRWVELLCIWIELLSSDWNSCHLIETLVIWLKLLSSDWNSCHLIETIVIWLLDESIRLSRVEFQHKSDTEMERKCMLCNLMT